MKLIFIHIPKTAGTSLTEAIGSQIPKERICPERLDHLNNWPVGELDRFTFFSGHFSRSAVERIPGEKRIATILREPASRLLSWYYFARSHTWFHIEQYAPELRPAKQLGLFDFLKREGAKIPSMVSMIGAGHLDSATQALHDMAAIGIAERSDDSLFNITWRFGLTPMRKMPKLNVTGDRVTDPAFENAPPKREPLTRELNNLLTELTYEDAKLYALAKNLFETQLEESRRANSEFPY